MATIHHGLAEGVYSFNEVPRDSYLAFLGRISPEKRPDRAISIAKRLGMRLKIAAKVDAVDVGYFHDEIKPLLADPLIEFIGEISDSEKSAFLGNASRTGKPGSLWIAKTKLYGRFSSLINLTAG